MLWLFRAHYGPSKYIVVMLSISWLFRLRYGKIIFAIVGISYQTSSFASVSRYKVGNFNSRKVVISVTQLDIVASHDSVPLSMICNCVGTNMCFLDMLFQMVDKQVFLVCIRVFQRELVHLYCKNNQFAILFSLLHRTGVLHYLTFLYLICITSIYIYIYMTWFLHSILQMIHI